ncbi:1-acyl-sn-glycerol-3-phosphate acyltransferase [Candidatus Woesearchaeota archaeon]|jgi:1-acyl-sn-glycerol-3-phosphate acyltransferase|nr:1-acyl-sn-glycerol-3-phosphate acyltransferase [Candidatus Woesearchaeota archaeon]|tara:strand:- start:208 stop:837 length:630 start_codon:yes stop_codon:yes gene_type:complete
MVYFLGKRTICPTVNLWFKEVKSLQNIPKKGAFIVAANHASYMDHLIIVCILIKHLNRKVHFLSKKEHFDNPLKAAWHRYAGAIPLDRQAGGKEALRWAIKALKKGKIIAIHPEGTRTLNGKLQKAKTGAARLALAAKVPIIPVGLIGTFEILPKGKYIPKLKRGTINIGKPLYFDKYYNKKITKGLLRKITNDIMKEIAKLCNQKYNL